MNTALVVSNDNSIAILEAIQTKLATITTVEDAKDVADQADVMLHCMKTAKLSLHAQNRCAFVRTMAQRHAGELLLSMDMLKGRPEKGSTATRLSDLKITHDQSARWQALAKVNVECFDSMLKECDKLEEEFTSAYVWRQLKYELSSDNYRLALRPLDWETTLKTVEADHAADRLLKAVWSFAQNLQGGRLHGDMGVVLADRATVLRWHELGLLERDITDGWTKRELESLTIAFVECRRHVDHCIEALRRRLDDAPVTWQEEDPGLMKYVDEGGVAIA